AGWISAPTNIPPGVRGGLHGRICRKSLGCSCHRQLVLPRAVQFRAGVPTAWAPGGMTPLPAHSASVISLVCCNPHVHNMVKWFHNLLKSLIFWSHISGDDDAPSE